MAFFRLSSLTAIIGGLIAHKGPSFTVTIFQWPLLPQNGAKAGRAIGGVSRLSLRTDSQAASKVRQGTTQLSEVYRFTA